MKLTGHTVKSLEVADKAFYKALMLHPFSHYTGTVTLLGMARRSTLDKTGRSMEKLCTILNPYITSGVKYGNFESYYCGGNGTAWLLWKGLLPQSADMVRECAELLYNDHAKTVEGVFSYPDKVKAEEGKLWIDTAFAVCPFLMYAGLHFENEEWLEEAYQQIAKPYKILLDSDCGLLHQSRGFCNNDIKAISKDHWSRGNGWGLLALTELAANYPKDHKNYQSILKMYTDLVNASLQYQDENGLWHQEMTRTDSYVETSGTGLILYAIGSAIEQGLDKPGWRNAFARGIKGYMPYIALDGSVHNTCHGCLCPGNGTIEEYMGMGYPVNDAHAHGPVVLAFSQAHKIGMEEVIL